MTSIHATVVARETYEWMVETGRFSNEAERRIEQFGRKLFLEKAARQWENAGGQRFMQGMKDVMTRIIWEELE